MANGLERSPLYSDDSSARQHSDPSSLTMAGNRPCNELISLLAHELRGPLATLTGYAQLLRTQNASPALRDKAVISVIEQARRLNTMVENLLQASRLSAGRLRIDRRLGDLVSWARQVVEQQQAIATEHRLLLSVPDGSLNAYFDPALVGLALGNILQNAIRFSPKDSIVSVSLRREDSRAVISVGDLGSGIPAEELSRVFEPYRTTCGGMGVGLFVAKGILAGHDGEVGINSKPGVGTTVWFSLPLNMLSTDRTFV